MLMSSSPSLSPSFHPPHCSPSVSAPGYRSPPASSSSTARRVAPSPRSFARSATHGLPSHHSSSSSSTTATTTAAVTGPAARSPRFQSDTARRQHSSSDASRTWAYVDASTQYSPLDWPPTSSRATVNISKLNLQSQSSASPAAAAPAPATTATAAAAPVTAIAATTAVTTAAGAAPTAAFVPQPVPPTHEPQLSRQQAHAEPAGSAAPPKPIVSDSQPPSEPHLGVTPHTALSNASSGTGALRRERSSTSDATSTDDASVDNAPSAPKRVRSDNAELKLLPMDYVDCDTKHLTVLISDMLLELIRYNDEIPLQEGQLTRFHSRAAPGISVRDYLQRLTFHATLSPPILLSMVCLIDKLCTAFPAFTINSLTVHRFLITAATVASKGLSDSFWTNNTYARVGGVTMKELALLELELLSKVEWRIVPTPEKLEEYYSNLVERHPDYQIETAPVEATKSDDAMDTSDAPSTTTHNTSSTSEGTRTPRQSSSGVATPDATKT